MNNLSVIAYVGLLIFYILWGYSGVTLIKNNCIL